MMQVRTAIAKLQSANKPPISGAHDFGSSHQDRFLVIVNFRIMRGAIRLDFSGSRTTLGSIHRLLRRSDGRNFQRGVGRVKFRGQPVRPYIWRKVDDGTSAISKEANWFESKGPLQQRDFESPTERTRICWNFEAPRRAGNYVHHSAGAAGELSRGVVRGTAEIESYSPRIILKLTISQEPILVRSSEVMSAGNAALFRALQLGDSCSHCIIWSSFSRAPNSH